MGSASNGAPVIGISTYREQTRFRMWDVTADGPAMDGCEQSGVLTLGPYSVVIFSRAG